MKIIVGLGNPGVKYLKTRHNVGYMTVGELVRNSKYRSLQSSKKIKIFRSGSFMNESGGFVSKILKTYSSKPDSLYIIHDDLDISLGEYKIQLGKGPKDHNGLKSIDDCLETDEYWHVRIGIENRDKDKRVKGEEYVLQDFTTEEEEIIKKVINEVCKKLVTL